VRAFLHRRPAEALALHDKALAVNPNLAMAWALSAFNHVYLGNLDEAETRINRYKRLSPLDPHAFFYDTAFIQLNLLRRDYESAVVVGRSLSQLNPSFSNMLKPYLAALGHLRYEREAEQIRAKLLAVEPLFTTRVLRATAPYERSQDLDHIIRGLELAGIPSG
jgi:tetratricopeptide (TPR) repeat protein